MVNVYTEVTGIQILCLLKLKVDAVADKDQGAVVIVVPEKFLAQR